MSRNSKPASNFSTQPNGHGSLEQEIQQLREQLDAVRRENEILRAAHFPTFELENVISGMNDAVVVYDNGPRVIHANEAAVNVFGFDPAGMSYYEALSKLVIRDEHNQPLPAGRYHVLRALNGEQVTGERLRVRNMFGEERFILASGSPLYQNNQIIGVVISWHDLTENERLLEENRRRKEMLESIITGAPVGIALLGVPDYQFELANPAYLEIARGKGEIIGQSFFDIWPEITEQFKPVLDHVCDSGELVRYTNQRTLITREQGLEEAYFNVNVSPVIGVDGKVEGLLILTLEVTSEVWARQRAEEEHHRLRVILQSLPVAVWIADADGRIIAKNEMVDRIWAGEAPLSSSLEQYGEYRGFWPASGEPVNAEDWGLARAIRNKETVLGEEITIQRFDGTTATILNYAAPILDGEGNLLGAVAASSDVTERKQIEQALRESEERFRLASQAVSGVLYELSIDRQRVFQSEGLEKLVGYKPGEEPDGNDWWPRNIHPDDYPRVQSELQAALSGGRESVSYEYRIRHRDGHWVYVSDQAYIVREKDGKPSRIVGTVVDITERKQAEQTLRESEDRFRAVLENSLDAAYRRDLRTDRYDYLSPVIEQVLGITIEEMISMGIEEVLDRVHPDDIATIERQLETLMTEGSGRLEYRFRDNEGNYRWVSDAASITYSETGEPVFRTGTVRDITERKRAEIALGQSEERFRTLADSMPQLVWTARPDGAVDYYNERWREFSGFSQQEDGSWNWSPAIHPDDIVDTQEAWTRAIASRGIYQVEQRVQMADGQYRWFLSRARPVHNEDGEVIKWYGTATDIHDYKIAEQALRESEEHFRVALMNSPISVYTCDTDLRYTWIHNPAHGFTAEEMLGKRDDELMKPENVRDLMEFKEQVLKSGMGMRREIRIRNGHEYIFDEYAEPLRDDDGRILGLTVAAVNITEQRQLEQAARRSAEHVEIQRQILQHREEERLQIARDLHDGPLQELIGATFSLADTINRVDDPLLTDRLTALLDVLQGQIGDIRSFCSELRPPSLAPFGLERAISAHANTQRERYPGLEIHLDLMRDGRALPEDLRMVLFRIYQESLNNIIKHARATRVDVRFGFDEQQVWLEVQDNGRGFEMPRDWVSMVRKGHFGLAGMRERAETVNAPVEIWSKPGEGTTVRVVVPLAGV